MRKKRIISLALAIMMIIGALPLGEIAYGQENYTVETINIYRTYEELDELGTYGISVSGTGLSKVNILYQPNGTDEFIPLKNPLPGSDDYFRQYRMDSGVIISKIRVGNKVFDINETDMPKVTEVKPSQIDLAVPKAEVKVKGENFDKFNQDNGLSIKISNIDVTGKFKTGGSEITLDKAILDKLQHGIKHIVIEKKHKDPKHNNVDIITTYNQRNAFRIYESIKIDQNDITIFPNRGKVGTEVTITIDGNQDNLSNFSVFFLTDETKPFMYENMGEDPYYPQVTDDNKKIIKVKVPKGLNPGQTYKVIITNNLDTVKKPKTDLAEYVTKQKTIGDFYVVDASVGPSIEKVVPKEGTSAGSYVTIYGYRFEELKMNGLTGDIKPVIGDNLEILDNGVDQPTKLRINYDKKGLKYNDKEVKEITRDFLVTIGRDALFEDTHKDKNIFIAGDDQEDQIYVKTKTLGKEDLKDPVKDVVIEITTIIKTEDGEFKFTEVAILPNGYTFLPSHQDPSIEKVTPDKIQVDSEKNPVTKENTILSIQGENFNVFRYKENGEFKTNYPKIVLGGSNEDTGQIIIEKKPDGEIEYHIKDEDGKIKKFEGVKNPIFEVLDKNGNIVTGIGGNEVGDSIVVKIPSGLKVSTNILNKTQPIAVANPKRDSKDRGIYSFKNDILSFVTVPSSPIIEKVDPYIVTVEGGEEITIEGRNFQDGIKVFIDGKEVQNVVRDIDKQTTRGTLKFKAPKGREGENIIQVMNPDGGSDTHQFIYVQTMKIDPKIISIAPNKGTKDTLVVIKGNNFLKSDQTVNDISGLGIYKLIGTRVFLGNEDVNKYNEEAGIITLKPYEVPSISGEKLLSIDKDIWTQKDYLKLSPYYKSAEIKDEKGKIHLINVDYEGHPVIVGKDELYTFSMINIEGENSIIAIDNNNKEYKVETEPNKLILKGQENQEGQSTTKIFDIEFNYNLFSIRENEFGTKDLKVADYYDSLILEHGNNNYLLEVDDLGKVTLSDGKNNIYEIIIDGGNILALKNGETYKVDVTNKSIKIGGETFTFYTPYQIDPQTKIITGHRAKVKNKNEIWISIPEKSIPGFYDIVVKNPDTKSDTVKNGFEYLIPQSRPKINYITPSQGSVEGGYKITIYGENFEDTSEVYIAGVKVPKKDLIVNPDYKSITIVVPKYPGDVNTDFITNKKFVPIVVVNEDGGTASREDLFSYVIASSRPRIDKINPIKGSAAGYEIVEIWGYDFRFFEPYKGEVPKKGDNNYEDIDRNGKWTNMKSHNDCDENWKKPLDRTVNNYNHYYNSPVLPKVYFGNNEAKIVEFNDKGYIRVITPRSAIKGVVDVYIVNNDAGTSPKIKYTYEGSNPNIKTITPNVGKRQGGEKIDIVGENFKENHISLFNENGKEEKTSAYLVRFGEISNRNIPREAANSGLIYGGKANINLPGELQIEYEIENEKPIIKLSLQHNKKTYTGKYEYSSGEKYIDLKGLKDSEGNNYAGFELVKVEIMDNRVLVDRGYSPNVVEKSKTQLEVDTPTYHVIGNVNVVVENPDGISNKVNFLYKNPDSKPQITNVKRDGQKPEEGDNNKILIQKVNVRSQSTITVEGKDFRDVEKVQIGNAEDITTFLLDNEDLDNCTITFKMPIMEGKVDTKRLYPVIVINDDGGTGSSAESIPKPIYIQFTSGESNPQIESISPDKGPSRGGTKVTIRGKDFREKMEGYGQETLKVYFDQYQVPSKDIRVIDYKTIEVITPKAIPGVVEVKVENPDTSMSNSVKFTYISGPVINRVEDPLTDRTVKYISVKGRQELRLRGEEFLPNARVVFAPKLKKAKTGHIGEIIYIDGETYILEEGINGTNFKFENDKTVTITTPQGKLDHKGVIIINPDGGASPIYDIIYGLPEIEAPEEVIAELVFDKYIKVHWQPVTGAEYYEIYEVDSRGRDEFIGSTELTSFLYKDILPNTNYRFLIKAVGEFGSSKPSMISNRVRTGRYSGYEDQDGKLGEYTSIDKTGEILNVKLGNRDYYRETIDLNKKEYKGTKEIIISIPLDLVYGTNNTNKLNIKGEDFNLSFSPSVFQNKSYEKHRGNKDAGIRFKISYNTGNTNLNGATSLSKQLSLEGDFYKDKEIEKIDNLSGYMNLKMNYDKDKAKLRKINKQNIYYFNHNQSKWIELTNTSPSYIDEISGNINKTGRYTILGHRR